MDATLTAFTESQWILCLLQITGLMLISWIAGRIALRKFPDISASLGVVTLTVSAGLIVLTWAGVPRPFALNASAGEKVRIQAEVEPAHPSMEFSQSTAQSELAAPSWFNRLAAMINSTAASTSDSATGESRSQLFTPVRIVNSLLLLTLLGGMVGVFRVIHSSTTIHRLARFSSPVEDAGIQAEVMRILVQLPTERQHQNISVCQFNEPGSPFVSWLTGNTIFVPESFLTWSDAEQAISLAHEIGHLQRRDHFCRLLTQLTFSLTWLHPLAWLLHRQTVLAQELAADQLAAQATENPSAYCRGLSRLALRFDAECRQPSALGVSISSGLIRRITMLKGITYHRLPCSRFVNRCITLSAFIACTWIGCWSVSGQTTPQEEQADSEVVTASHSEPVTMFSQPTTAPWETIGNQSGYLKVQVSRVLNHPDLEKYYEPMIATVLNSTLRSEPDATQSFEQFGLGLDEITQVQGGLSVQYIHNPEAQDGHRSSLAVGLSTAEVTAADPVDWPGLINAFDFDKLRTCLVAGSAENVPENLDMIRESWLKTAQKSRSNVFEAAPLWNHLFQAELEWQEPTESKKAIWEAVSGGAATIVYDIVQSGEAPEDYEEQDPLNQANFEMTIATETAAWGVDFSQDYKTCQVRFAAVPCEGVSTDELLRKFETLKDACMQSDVDDELSLHLLEQFKQAKVTIVESKTSNGEMTKAYLLVEGECSADLSNFISDF